MSSSLTVLFLSLLLAIPAAVFWLWLVIVPARVAMLCPEACWCDPGGIHVSCNGTSLNPIPLIHLTDVRVLFLIDNNITLLERDTFVSVSELYILFINHCGLRTIEVRAFNWLSKLTALSITDNEITEIIPGTFQNMNSLEILSLINNRLEHLDRDVFSGLVNLQRLIVDDNNLHYVHPDTFLSIPNPQRLHLSADGALQIPTDRHFINSHSLSSLGLSYCNISSLSVEAFANFSALVELDLGGNNLKTVDINILRAMPELSALYLYGNPLQCDCKLQEVWRWCEDRHIRTVYWGEVPVCDTPSGVEGMWWGVLQIGQCSDGIVQYSGDYNGTSYVDSDIDQKFYYTYDVNFFKQYQLPLYAFPFIFGTITNVALLMIIIRNEDMRTVPNMYLLNLVICNIIYLTVLFSEACANTVSNNWLKGNFLCTFLPFCRRLSVGLSAYSVAVFSVQLYRGTVNRFQLRVSSPPTWRVTVATVCGVWIGAALFAVPSALTKYQCEPLPVSRRITYYQLVVIFELFVSCAVPLCVIAFCYIMTVRHLVEISRAMSEGTQNPQLKTCRKTANILVGLTAVFLISYVPYHALWTYINCTEGKEYFLLKITDILDDSNSTLRYTYLISTCFLSINPSLNPVALFCTSSPFRQHLKRYLTCSCTTNSPPTHLELRRRN
jgi:hypothetical protein